MFDLFAGVTAAILSVAKVLRLRKPGPMFLVYTKEEDTMLVFKFNLPEKSAPDVTSRELTVQSGTNDPTLITLPPEVTETDTLQGNEGDVLTVSLVDIDDAGNRSEARTQEFTLADTIPPAQPGEIGLVVTEELPDEEPVDPVDPEPEV